MISNAALQANWACAIEKIQHNWPELTAAEIHECDRDTRKLIARINHRTGATIPEIESVLESITMGEGVMEKAVEDFKKQAESAVESTQEAAHAAFEQGQHLADEAAARISEGYAETERMVRSKPLESVAICFGVGLISGLVIGLSMRR